MAAEHFVLVMLLALSLAWQDRVEAFITDLKLVACDAGHACPNYPGFQKLPVNLNQGTTLPVVHLHVKEDPTADPITAIRIVKTPKALSIPKWTALDVDLNLGGDESESLWLYYSKDTSVSPNPVTSIVVKAGAHPETSAEYARLPIDLNDGVGGDRLHIYYSQDGPKEPITAINAQACFTDNCYMEGWERVEKDVNEGVGVGMRVYLFYQRVRGAPPVTDVVILLNHQTAPEGYEKVSTDLNAVTLHGDSIHLWYKTSPDLTEVDRAQALQEIAIEYGEDSVTPFGWTKNPVDLNSKNNGQDSFGQPTHLYFRRALPAIKPLSFDALGQFKILQLADLHLTHERGVCRDIPPKMKCKGHDSTLEFIEALLSKEKPDLVVFTGDNVDGSASVGDSRAAIFKFSQPIIKHKIPWAAIFGNHDDEADLSREEMLEVIRRLPFSVTQRGPRNVPGVGNFALPLYTNQSTVKHAFTVYCLDSHAYANAEKSEYAFIQPEQLDWLKTASLGFSRNQDTVEKPNAIAFFHIPIWEYNAPEKGPHLRLGDQRETVSSPKKGTQSVLQAFKAAGDIKVTSCGHDHVNDYCQDRDGIHLCYGGGLGLGGYGASHLGWPRRARIFQISQWGAGIQTWKRLHDESLTMTGYQALFSPHRFDQ